MFRPFMRIPNARRSSGVIAGTRRMPGSSGGGLGPIDVGIEPASRRGLILHRSANDIPLAYLKDNSGEGPYYNANDVIVQASAKYNVLFHGDSITVGVGATDGYAYQFLRQANAAGFVCNYKNRGINGQGLGFQYTNSAEFGTLTADAAGAIDVARSSALPNRLVIFAGTNDIYLNAKTGAQTYTLLTTYIDARIAAGWLSSEIYVITMLPRGLNTAERQNYNNAIVGDAGGRGYKVVAAHLNGNIGDDGDQNNATYFSDTVHPTNAGHTIIATLLKAQMFP